MNGNIPSEVEKNLKDLTLDDFTITDEFDTVDVTDPLKLTAEKMLSLKKGIIFVMEKNKPKGIIGIEEIIKAVSEGSGPDTPSGKVASDSFLEVEHKINVADLIPLLIRDHPRAVVVKGDEGEFKGFFSPHDYLESLKKAGILK